MKLYDNFSEFCLVNELMQSGMAFTIKFKFVVRKIGKLSYIRSKFAYTTDMARLVLTAGITLNQLLS